MSSICWNIGEFTCDYESAISYTGWRLPYPNELLEGFASGYIVGGVYWSAGYFNRVDVNTGHTYVDTLGIAKCRLIAVNVAGDTPVMKSDFKDFASASKKIGDLLHEKNEVYGSSVEKSADIMRVLFPKGIPETHYIDALLMVRVCDKLARLSHEGDNSDAWMDISGYGIYGYELHRIKNENKKEPKA